MVREGFTYKVTFEQRKDRSQGASKVENWSESPRPRGKECMSEEQKRPLSVPGIEKHWQILFLDSHFPFVLLFLFQNILLD